MFDKLDKIFLILLLLIICPSIIFVLLFSLIANTANLGLLAQISIFFCYYVVPICVLGLVILLIAKILKKSKNKKDWIIIFLNLVLVVVFTILLAIFYLITSNPLL